MESTRTLFIFDDTGYIYYVAIGNVREPEGMDGNKIWVEVPQGKRVASFDMSGDKPDPVFVDLPKSEVEALKEENLKLKLALAELAEVVLGGVGNG